MKTNSSPNPLRHIVLMIALSLCAASPVSAAEAEATKPKGLAAKGVDANIVGEETAVLTQAPQVPPPLKRTHATGVPKVRAAHE